MTTRSELGQVGENLACEYLVDKGYKILKRNYRKPWGELDIIARAPDKTLVFVEVKTLRLGSGQALQSDSGRALRLGSLRQSSGQAGQADQLQPEDHMTSSKILKTQKAAQLYAGHYPELIDDNRGWRIDVLAITIKTDSIPEIAHYENVDL